MKDVLGALLEGHARVAAAPITEACSGPLLEAEHAAVALAVDKRRREFTAGRVLARRLLGELGCAAAALPVGPDRAPLWPPGVLGSITHTDTWCAVAVARTGPLRALGIDAETFTPLSPELERIVLRPEELEVLTTLERRYTRGELAKLVFSAKECTYKCQHVLTRQMLEFDDVAIALDLERGRFDARVLHAGARAHLPEVLHGVFAHAGETVITAMWIADR